MTLVRQAGLALAVICFLAILPASGKDIMVETLPPDKLSRLSREEILSASGSGFAPYILRENPRVVVITFPSLHEQAMMFGRMVLFVERNGTPKTRLMTHAEVQQWLAAHGQRIETLTVGNNFRASQLARFFNTARAQGEALSSDEKFLHDWLLQTRLLRKTDDDIKTAEPEAVLITLPQASSVPNCAACTVKESHRRAILEHELAHARFVTDERYQEYVRAFWTKVMSQEARSKFTQFLRKRGYNTSDEELLANEMQAFLMHTPDVRMFAAAAVDMTDMELHEIRRQFQDGFHSQPALTFEPQ